MADVRVSESFVAILSVKKGGKNPRLVSALVFFHTEHNLT